MMVFYRGLALHPAYVDGFIDSCLDRVAEDRPGGARTRWRYLEDPELRGHVLDILKSECEVKAGHP